MEEQHSEEPKTIKEPRRRWFQVSLRMFLLLIAFASVGFGWLGYKVMQAREQQQAVKAILMLGGDVVYDVEYDVNDFFIRTTPRTTWYRTLFGIDLFHTVNEVSIPNDVRDLTDTDLVILKAFPKIRRLEILSRSVTDDGLIYLGNLNEVGWLVLRFPKVTNAGLVHLEGMTNLRNLDLRCPKVTDAGLVHIQRLTNLKVFCRANTQITDDGIDHLIKMKPGLVID